MTSQAIRERADRCQDDGGRRSEAVAGRVQRGCTGAVRDVSGVPMTAVQQTTSSARRRLRDRRAAARRSQLRGAALR
eukprot:6334303-Alexandrium_andersonii.AAC.1